MSERLTTTKKREPELFEGLDDIDENQYFIKIVDQTNAEDFSKVANKLGQYEDIDESPEQLVKKVNALEIIKKYPKVRNSLQNFRYMVNYWQKNKVVVTTELLKTYDFPYELDEYELLKEVLL